jgi:hypothetical protein
MRTRPCPICGKRPIGNEVGEEEMPEPFVGWCETCFSLVLLREMELRAFCGMAPLSPRHIREELGIQ